MSRFISSLEMTYVNEIAPRDHFVVYVWEPTNNSTLDHSDILCEIHVGDQIVFKIMISVTKHSVLSKF